MTDPSDTGAVAALGQSVFGGGGQGAPAAGRSRERIAAWDDTLERRGVAALARAICDPAATAGLLTRRAGERLLTDVQHLFDLLASEAPSSPGAATLLEALQRLRAAEREASDEDVRARRIDTDAPAVRLMTVHGAKGLEFGVVLCPFIQQTRSDELRPLIWRDETIPGRLLDAGGREAWSDERLSAPTREARAALAEAAAGGESRRLHYVALTRAMHRCVVWWLRAYDGADQRRDELAALLFDRDAAHRPIQRPRAMRDDTAAATSYDLDGAAAIDALRGHFGALCNDGLLEVAAVRGRNRDASTIERRATSGLAPASLLSFARLDRTLTLRELRCSFSSLVSGTHVDGSLDDAVGDAGASDEGPGPDEPDGVDDDPFGGLRGAPFGSAVHEALEEALRRPRHARFDDALVAALHVALRRHSVAENDQVAEGLLAAAATPLHGGTALRDLAHDDVSTELRFALPVAAGVGLAAICTTIAERDDDGPFADWARALAADAPHRPLASSLVGSIDLVTTLGTTERYGVIDYKTNVWPRSQGGYTQAGLRAAMSVADYPLQAALYLVALHRYLRWRLEGYDPSRHLGGAHYLFLRGMRAGSQDGICSWSPPPEAIVALSDLLAGAR
jgi:exodeoxyribonuclease V beta subunit